MANLINADPTAGLKLVSSSSSDIQIQSNGVTVCTINADGLSMNTGTLAGNGPAFSASSAGQSVSNSTWTKVAYSTEQFDTNSNYDNATNYRFQPTVAGYYQINVSAAMNTGSPFQIASAIYKNGSPYSYGTNTTGSFASVSTVLLYLNGSTDYVEGYCIQVSGGSLNTVNSVFSGTLTRSA